MPTIEIAIDSRKAKAGADQAARALDNVGKTAQRAGQQMDQLSGNSTRGVRRATEEFRGFGKAAAGVSGVLGASASVTQFSREIGNLGSNLNSGTNAAFAFSRALLEISRVKEDFGDLSKEVGKTSGVMGTLFGLVKANPLLVLSTAVAAIIPLWGLFAGGADKATEALERQKKATQDLRAELDKLQQTEAFRQFAAQAGLPQPGITRESVLTSLAERQAAIRTQGAVTDPQLLVQFLQQQLQSLGIAGDISGDSLFRTRTVTPVLPGFALQGGLPPSSRQREAIVGETGQRLQIELISKVVELINNQQITARTGPGRGLSAQPYGPPLAADYTELTPYEQGLVPTLPNIPRGRLYGPPMPGEDYFAPSPYEQQKPLPLPYAPDPTRGVETMLEGVAARFAQAGEAAFGVLQQIKTDVIQGERQRYEEQLEQYQRMQQLSQQFIGTLTSGLESAIFEGQKFGDVMRAVFVDISRQAFRAGVGQVFQGVNFFGSAPTQPGTTAT